MDAGVHWTHLMSSSTPGKLSAPKGPPVAKRQPPMPVNMRTTRRGRM
jgi:hypothetical protein